MSGPWHTSAQRRRPEDLLPINFGNRCSSTQPTPSDGLSSTLYEFGQVSACNRPIASSPADRPEGFLPTRYRALMLKNTRPSTGAAVPLPKRR